jgi:AraC-like DNA-binding protein
MPTGVSLHLCATHGATHASSQSFFLSESRFFPLAESLIEESQNQNTHSAALTRHYLLALLLHLDRALSQSRAPLEEERAMPLQDHATKAESTPTQRACRFIESNLSQKLLLSQISSYAYISPTQLNRLFRSEMQISVGEYITQRRMEKARALLRTTDLPVGRIGVLCGYPHAEYFSRAFHRESGVSPGAYRHQTGSRPSSP